MSEELPTVNLLEELTNDFEQAKEEGLEAQGDLNDVDQVVEKTIVDLLYPGGEMMVYPDEMPEPVEEVPEQNVEQIEGVLKAVGRMTLDALEQ